jgi:hypothetical protein
LRQEAASYEEKLDQIAPIVGRVSHRETVEGLLEFLSLPFWKHRWYLYELWTSVCVLEIAQRLTDVELSNLQHQGQGILEWVLPGGAAKEPIATIGQDGGQILCWSQRKTYHPQTKAGLEPDLRLTKASPGYHDIIIIENKDRKTAQPQYISEILERYVGGTCAESIWITNYEEFPDSVVALEGEWPDRHLHIVSRFRPGSVPEGFELEIEEVLRHNLPTESLIATMGDDIGPVKIRSLTAEATLAWGSSPRDLDLHSWVKDPSGIHHIYYGDRGSLDAPPFVMLDQDHIHGDGMEKITMKLNEFEWAVIGVRNYSKESGIAGSRAIVRLNLGKESSLSFEAPPEGKGEWWHVLRLNKYKEHEVLNYISQTEPDLL